MTDAFGTASLVTMAALLGGVVASALLGSPAGRLGPSRQNYRGLHIPVNLGIVLATTVVATRLLVLAVIAIAGGSLGLVLVAQLASVVVVLAGAFYDDLHPERTRGVVRQLVALARGRITPGAVKLAAALGAGAVAVASVRGDGISYLLGIPMIAGFANLGNLLDVRPGRSIKFFVPVAVAMGVLEWPSQSMLLTAVTVGGALAILPSDLQERGMLGDAGAFVLWITLGIGLYDAVARTGLAIGLGTVVGLHLLSETITLSRLIRWLPPLRWLDEVGRLQPFEAESPNVPEPDAAPLGPPGGDFPPSS